MNATEHQTQRILRRQVKQALDFNVLAWFCTADESEFSGYGDYSDLGCGDFYIHRNNESQILGVAHLDSVQRKRKFHRYSQSKGRGDIIFSPCLDDRLGAYVICELLPKLGVNVDILLTTGEEWCASTACCFQADKRYNWSFSFDRAGTDVVMYQYTSPRFRPMLKELGLELHIGSYSDISDLGHLGCAGLNFGTGYHNYHEPGAYALVDELTLQVARFQRFFALHSQTHFAYERPTWSQESHHNDYDSDYWPTTRYRPWDGAAWNSQHWNDNDQRRYRCPDCDDDKYAPYGRHTSLHNLTDEEIKHALP